MKVATLNKEVTETLKSFEERYDSKYVVKVCKTYSMYLRDCLHDEAKFISVVQRIKTLLTI